MDDGFFRKLNEKFDAWMKLESKEGQAFFPIWVRRAPDDSFEKLVLQGEAVAFLNDPDVPEVDKEKVMQTSRFDFGISEEARARVDEALEEGEKRYLKLKRDVELTR